MATLKIIKKTAHLVVAKVFGTGSATITLNSLATTTQSLIGTRKVSIGYVQWNISPGATDVIKVTRNSVDMLHLQQNSGELDMSGNGGYLDNTEEESDIVVNIVGTGDVYLTLRKTDGYESKVEPEYFGDQDNETVVGS